MAYPLFPSNPSPSPSSARSSTSGETREREKEKGVNVQVLVRCRPLHEDEQKSKTVQVIACNEHRREVTVHLNAANKQVDRSFTFDRVFGPQAQQKDLYDQAIVPIVTEVLEGFNCTVFAYGQTGTGKTYTMEGGGRKTKNGELPHDSGVIPRAVQQIFDTLDSQSADYSMKVTFLELYNEEITDLLATDDPSRSIDDKQRKPLTLMEDGKGGVLVRGLEEEVVYSALDIYALLERGSAKRRTAETLLNKQSSRSHSIFSITMHIKEVTPEGVEFIKCGKLNLVDLAGSENISRSGAKEGRAREAGEINKSLLTLGRVITSLVEHSGHVPYRDSKLTRLLRDSLGGRTKTCIIATISPSVLSLEETLSTLDYAHRAKNIKNRPEVNQKMMKSVLIKDLYLEIERLKSEVLAAREKNGVYIPRERYFQAEAEKKAMAERIEHMESESEARIKQVEELKESLDYERQQCADLNDNLEGTQKKLAETQDFLFEANEKIKHAQYTIKEREFVISNLKQSENNLIEQANVLQLELEKSSNDISELHLKIERKEKVETENHRLVQSFHSNLSQQLASLRGTVSLSSTEQQLLLKTMGQQFQSFLCKKQDVTEELRKKALSVKDLYYSGLKDLSNLVHMHEKDSSSTFEKLNSTCSSHVSSLEKLLSAAVSEAEFVLKNLQQALNNQENEIADFIQHQQQSAKQSMEVTKSISEVTNGFFSTLDCSTTALCNSVCESKQIQRQSIEELERKYEECALSEEKQLLEKMAEMLAASRARKSTLVHSKLSSLRDLAEKDSDALQKGMHEMQTVAVEVQQKWQSYETQVEDGYSENAATVSLKQRQMSELMQSCFKASVLASEKWKQAEESLQKLEKNHLVMVESIVGEGVHGNGVHLTNFDQKSLSIQADVDSSNEAVIRQAQGALALDKEGAERLCASTATLSSALTELQTSHERGSLQIQNEADHCFRTEYQEDEPTCSTPRQRHIGVPSQDEIAALKAASMEQLVEEFQAANPFLSAINHSDNENCKSSMGKDMASLLATSPRVPLTSVNNL